MSLHLWRFKVQCNKGFFTFTVNDSQLQSWLVIKLYEAFESLQYDDHVVANPFGCNKMKECLEDPDMNKKDCKRNGSDFHGKKKYCPICDSKTKSISLGSYGRVRFFRMKHNRLKVRIHSWVNQRPSLPRFWLESKPLLVEYIFSNKARTRKMHLY